MHFSNLYRCTHLVGWTRMKTRLKILCDVERAGSLPRHVEQETSPFGLILPSSRSGEPWIIVNLCIQTVNVFSEL